MIVLFRSCPENPADSTTDPAPFPETSANAEKKCSAVSENGTEKDGYDTILSSFSEGKADILVGTQMIVKGHDFGKVTLMGVLLADLSLGVSEYSAAERTFHLLAQAAGRAGRDKLPGRVVIQTYRPDHYALLCAAAQDYPEF